MTLWQDVRFAARTFIKTPTITVAALLSIALGIAANTAVFTLVNAVLFKPMPVAHPEQLVALYTTDPTSDLPSQFSYPDYRDYRDNNTVFSDLFVHNGTSVSFKAGTARAELIWAELVTGNYFRGLGLVPAAGRLLTPDDDAGPGERTVVVLSHAFWQRRFGGDPAIIGSVVRVTGRDFTVVGVARQGFSGTRLAGFIPDVWVPMSTWALVVPGSGDTLEQRGVDGFNINGRLKPGVSIAQATTALNVIAEQLARTYPQTNAHKRVGMVPAGNKTQPAITLLGYVPLVASLMMGVVGLVLVIACANVANLLLARATARRREIAMRLALGARRARLVRQLLTENVLLAVVGGVLGLMLARWFVRLVPMLNPVFDFASVDFEYDLALDRRVLLFTALTSIVTGVVFGVLPAYQSSRTALAETLRAAATPAATGWRRLLTLRGSLIVCQVALSLALLAGAGLFVRSMRNAQHLDPGFETQNILLASIDAGVNGYDEARGRRLFTQALDRIRALPGVEAASIGGPLPLDAYSNGAALTIEGYVPRYENERLSAGFSIVGDGYFSAMKTTLVAGRAFTVDDDASAPPVVVVNETMARRFWPNENAVGKRLRLGDERARYREVIGVAKDGKYLFFGEPPTPYLFVPHAQSYDGHMTVIVRTSGPPASLASAVRQQLASLDPDLPVYGVKTMPGFLDRLLSIPTSIAALVSVFGLIALAMSAIGLYGVVGHSVAQRTREIGVRMALGARRVDVFRLVIGQGMTLVAIGIFVGLAAALALSRFAGRLLYDVGARDPLTFTVVTIVLALVAFAACYLPARRATRFNPVVALRYE